MRNKVKHTTFDNIKTVGDLRKALKGVDKGTRLCVYVYATGEEYPIAFADHTYSNSKGSGFSLNIRGEAELK